MSDRTKLILLNTPHNPTGKVFDADELARIAAVAIEHDLIVVADEVYEHLVFDGSVHTPICTLPDMFERTLSISSGGKTFHTTGWKIGWMTGPAELVDAATLAKQFLTFTNGAPFQPATAVGLRLGDEYFDRLRSDLQVARDRLADGRERCGFTTYRPEASYFVTVDVSSIGFDGDAVDFCRRLPEIAGVVAVPASAFYVRPEHGANLVRFACCKRLAVIDAAVEQLLAAFVGEAS